MRTWCRRCWPGRRPQFGWPVLAQLLAEVSSGVESKKLKEMPAVAPQHEEIPGCASARTVFSAAVFCSDYGPQRDYAKLSATGHAGQGGAALCLEILELDADSSRLGRRRHLRRLAARGGNPPHLLKVGPRRDVMVANTTHDPPTPLANAVSLYLQIPEARLLIADVDGHQSLAVVEMRLRD